MQWIMIFLKDKDSIKEERFITFVDAYLSSRFNLFKKALLQKIT